MHEFSSFLTLTYSQENVPLSLDHRHFQKFLKRLRKRVGPVRYFMCGEYGETFSRPHFHACIFGYCFPDRELITRPGASVRLYRSGVLESLWPFGFSTVGDVTFESAAYVARYVMKKVTGDAAEEHYQRVSLGTGELVRVKPEYCQMSRRPGIGAAWFEKYASDVFGREKDGVRIGGRKVKAPRYYKKILEQVDPALSDEIDFRRYEAITDDVVAENEPERLAVREAVEKARLRFKGRTL